MGELVKVERPLRVLVVDDSSLYRQMLMRSLAEVDGVEVIDCACDGVEALEKIERLHGKSESEVIKIMRKNLKPKSFKLWRERVSGRTRKHEKKRSLSSKPFKAEDYV